MTCSKPTASVYSNWNSYQLIFRIKSFTPSAQNQIFPFHAGFICLHRRYFCCNIVSATVLIFKTYIYTYSQRMYWKTNNFLLCRHCAINYYASKAGALLEPHRCPEFRSHQELCTFSYSIHHTPAQRIQYRHVDTGLGESFSQCQSPGRPDGQLQIYPRPFFTDMCVSLCCLGRSWNRHHTSWMQISHLIWHFQ